MLELPARLNLSLTLDHGPSATRVDRERLFLRKRRGESMAHVAMKLASYLCFYHPELRVEASANQHYKPDLLRVDDAGHPVQWIDCGQTSVKKLDTISQRNTRTLIHIVKPHGRALEAFRRAAEPRLARPERVRWVSFEDGFIEGLAGALSGRHTLEARVPASGDRLSMRLDGAPHDTALIVLGAG